MRLREVRSQLLENKFFLGFMLFDWNAIALSRHYFGDFTGL
jgi:hypothetical protein